jgi:putative DNA primase/helicase
MTAAELADALGGRRAGSVWMARCPSHRDRTPSLSICEINSGKVLVHCHAGCDQQHVIAELRARGLWGKNRGRAIVSSERPTAVERKSDHEEYRRTTAALAIWESAIPAMGTPVEVYLGSRGLHLPPSDVLRFHAGLKHPSGSVWPAIVAQVTNGADGTALAVHRTFLARTGESKAPVDPQKMMLGPCRGGAVRLAEPGEVLMVGEGIETCLAAMQATGHPAWAALSTSGMRSLDLPNTVDNVIVLADGDDNGEAAAQDSACRWMHQGRRVRIARPPRGMDFNDLLIGRKVRIEGAAMSTSLGAVCATYDSAEVVHDPLLESSAGLLVTNTIAPEARHVA